MNGIMSNEFSFKLKLLTGSSIITKITKREEGSEEVSHVSFFKIFQRCNYAPKFTVLATNP